MAINSIGQSKPNDRAWVLEFQTDQEHHTMTINYASPTGETLSVNKDYTNPDELLKTISFNADQSRLIISRRSDGTSVDDSLFSDDIENDQNINYGQYQSIIEEYRLALAETQAGLGANPYGTIESFSNFYDRNENIGTRSALECSAAFFAFTAAAITEEIVCVAELTPACSAAISTALSTFASMIAICSSDDDDDDDGDPGTGGSGGGGSGGSDGGSTTVYVYGGGGGGGGGGSGGGADCTFTTVDGHSTLTCRLH